MVTPCVLYPTEVKDYPQFNRKRGDRWLPRRAHVELWEARYGPILAGWQIHHLCENKRCLNIYHYALIRSADHQRLFHHPTHCKRGHDLAVTGYVRKDNGHRMCRVCASERLKARYHQLHPEALYEPRRNRSRHV